jgi:hypothetical protein
MSRIFARIGSLFALMGVLLTPSFVGASAANAADHLTNSKSESLMCPITTDVEVYRQAYEVRGRTRYRAVVRTSTSIGPNEYLFVGCRIGVKARLMLGGEQLSVVEHEALAGAKWDPWGNHKWYTWEDALPIEDLEDADHVEILHEQR